MDYTYWNRVLTDIDKKKSELSNPKVIWYRGVNDENKFLVSSLIRNASARDKEKAIFKKFQLINSRYANNEVDQWRTLFDMQHYGIPTRLLDWTETFGVALFFALLNYDVKKKPAIYILDPLKLNSKSGKSGIVNVNDLTRNGYLDFFDSEAIKLPLPIAIEPPFQNERIISQNGKFTIQGVNLEPLEDLFPEAVRKITISKEAIPACRLFLEQAGINIFSMFPGMDSMAPYLKEILEIT